jgi:hypothetical protein
LAYNFTNRVSTQDIHNVLLKSFGAQVSNEDLQRLTRNSHNWNFYDGYHWEKLPDTDKPQVTVNYVRAFVDKFVAFELGKGFTVKMKPEIEQIDGDNDPLDFINNVWEYNNKLEKSIELGQSKAITGDGWVGVSFEPKFDSNGKRRPEFIDPFDEYERGKIVLTVLPDSICFPVYNDAHNKDHLELLRIMYPVTVERDGFFGNKQKTEIYKQEWTNERVKIFMGQELIADYPNKYGTIPFRHIKNYPQQGRNEGLSDIEDVIPLNMEINLKKSDISEIIDYHSAPVTVVFGARIGQLERGANKVWGGLPKDARIENLKLDGDLIAAQNYVADLKKSMHEVGNIPEGVLGGDLAISNTSGVALQIALMPLLERVKVKQVMTKEGLEYVNKLILLVGLVEGLITIPKDIKKRADFFYNEVTFENILPKDTLLELQEMELEMRLGLESREGAMKRRGKDNIQKKITEIDEDMKKNPSLYGKEDIEEQIELMKEQAKIQPKATPQPTSTNNTRKVGENKEGNPKQVNAGFQNSPQPKN